MTKVRVWNISLFVVNFHPIKLSQLHWNGNKSDTDASSVMMMMTMMMMVMMMMMMIKEIGRKMIKTQLLKFKVEKLSSTLFCM